MKNQLLLFTLITILFTSCEKCRRDPSDCTTYELLSEEDLKWFKKPGDTLVFKSNTGLYDTAVYGGIERYETNEPHHSINNTKCKTNIVQKAEQKVYYMSRSKIYFFSIKDSQKEIYFSDSTFLSYYGGCKNINNIILNTKIYDQVLVCDVISSKEKLPVKIFYNKEMELLKYTTIHNNDSILWERIR